MFTGQIAYFTNDEHIYEVVNELALERVLGRLGEKPRILLVRRYAKPETKSSDEKVLRAMTHTACLPLASLLAGGYGLSGQEAYDMVVVARWDSDAPEYEMLRELGADEMEEPEAWRIAKELSQKALESVPSELYTPDGEPAESTLLNICESPAQLKELGYADARLYEIWHYMLIQTNKAYADARNAASAKDN